MRAINRRIGRLENSLGVVETEDMRHLRERAELWPRSCAVDVPSTPPSTRVKLSRSEESWHA
jgi:hypothetical protein